MSAADDAAARIQDMIHASDGPFSRDVRLVLADREAIRQAANAVVDAKPAEVDRALYTLAALLGQYEAGAL